MPSNHILSQILYLIIGSFGPLGWLLDGDYRGGVYTVWAHILLPLPSKDSYVKAFGPKDPVI